MAVISAVIDKMTSSTTLLTNYSGIMDSLEGMISTDFESGDISALINMRTFRWRRLGCQVVHSSRRRNKENNILYAKI